MEAALPARGDPRVRPNVARRRRLGPALLVGVALTTAGTAQRRETGFLDRTVEVGGAAFRYQVYVPSQYTAATRWPVILFLHGAGERGGDGLLQTEVGLGSAVRRFPDRYPAIVVFPQAPRDSSWTGTAGTVAMAALDRTMREFRADPGRVYLAGLSMGGQGSWFLAYTHPERFAAAVVICGFAGGQGPFRGFIPDDGGAPEPVIAKRISGIPLWVFHGDSDTVVPVEASRAMVEALRRAGAAVRYSELPGVGHNAWDAAFQSAELAAWLFAQRKR
jgi:predicted peptidase